MQPKWFNYLYPVSYMYPVSSSGAPYPSSSSAPSSSSSSPLPQSMPEDGKVHPASHVRHASKMTSRTGRGRQPTTYIEPAEPTVSVHPVFYYEPVEASRETMGIYMRSGPGAQGGSMAMLAPAPPTAAQMHDDTSKAPRPSLYPSCSGDAEEDTEEPLELSSCMQRRLQHTLADPSPFRHQEKRVSFSDDMEDHGPLYGLDYLAAFPDFRRSANWKVNALELIY